jgi:hypothetical protein
MARKPARTTKRAKVVLAAAPRRHPGRGGHQPTEQSRDKARTLAGLGLPQDMIALLLGIDAKTLRKHYEAEMALGSAQATQQVATTLFTRATRDRDLSAAIFWMKVRAGWSERAPDQRVKHSGRVEHEHGGEVTHRVLTEEQRAAVLAAVRARAVDDVGSDGGGLAPAD